MSKDKKLDVNPQGAAELPGVKPTKIYISGPMTGLPEHNYPAFFEAEKLLKKAGFQEIVNPARLGEQASWEEYMKRDIQLLCQCDGVAFLDGWGDSKGARLEVQIANALGITVTSLESWIDLEQVRENFRTMIADFLNDEPADLIKEGSDA
ncbi:MAG: DUF4406 domain-containing protein [Endozoicomonas sp.]